MKAAFVFTSDNVSSVIDDVIKFSSVNDHLQTLMPCVCCAEFSFISYTENRSCLKWASHDSTLTQDILVDPSNNNSSVKYSKFFQTAIVLSRCQ